MQEKGGLIIHALFLAFIGMLLVGGLVSWALFSFKISRQTFYSELAFQAAEAGIDYYRWHLAHASQDYQDGTGAPGPYVHDFRDKDGNIIGQFSLEITPPPIGSTIVTIRSTGNTTVEPALLRTIETKLAIPSWARYAWALNSFVRFGETSEVFGPIHSNAGIRFDGLAHNIVSSAQTAFDDPDHGGANEFGVHTHGNSSDPGTDPLPPGSVPNRPLIFEAGRQFPVPAIDFTGLTADLADIRSDAQTDGLYLAPSGALGYHVVLRTDDTFDVYQVNALFPPPGGCVSGASGWGTWSIGSEAFLQNYPIPGNGLLFVEDHVWVDGQIDGARLTIASGRFPDTPATRTNIIINNDTLYTNYDGQDVLSFIAQRNFLVGLRSEDDLRIDGAAIAQNGFVGRYSYSSSSCGAERSRNSLTTYGMLGSNQRAVFAYSATNGYQTRTYNYDVNLLYGPPPSFPLTSDQYIILSWEEVES